MGEGELVIFFNKAKPGAYSMGDEKKTPRKRLRRMLVVGRRESAWRSVAFRSEPMGKMAIPLLLGTAAAGAASADQFRTAVAAKLHLVAGSDGTMGKRQRTWSS